MRKVNAQNYPKLPLLQRGYRCISWGRVTWLGIACLILGVQRPNNHVSIHFSLDQDVIRSLQWRQISVLVLQIMSNSTVFFSTACWNNSKLRIAGLWGASNVGSVSTSYVPGNHYKGSINDRNIYIDFNNAFEWKTFSLCFANFMPFQPLEPFGVHRYRYRRHLGLAGNELILCHYIYRKLDRYC